MRRLNNKSLLLKQVMAQTLKIQNQDILYDAPKDLQPFLKSTTKGTKFNLFFISDNWNKKPSSQYSKLTSRFNSMSKK